MRSLYTALSSVITLDVYDIWLYPLQDWWKTVNEISNFMSTEKFHFFTLCKVVVWWFNHVNKPWKGVVVVTVN